MTIQLFDSKTQELQPLNPVTPGRVTMYVCGPTVQSSPHIGHLRSALIYDQLRNWLEYRGYQVTLLRNVTDIDDKILVNAAESGEDWWSLAYRFELEFTAAYSTLGIRPPTYEPRATASIPQMQRLISTLIERGHAYVAQDGSGDVYFDTNSWVEYGALTRQKLDDMADAQDADPRGKRDPRDFALWKGHKPDEPLSASWESPWGGGRPGWHIECSAMSTQYLGTEFDIHGGGLDLRFPHHENELAQSSAAGHAFARLWIHNGLVSIGDQKMSKSLGNSVFAHDLLGQAPAAVVRYFLGSAHYRSTLEYQPNSLAEAASALERITGFLDRARRRLISTRFAQSMAPAEIPEAFAEAMDDDLSIPAALAVLHETVRSGNAALDGEDLDEVARSVRQVTGMTDVLGLSGTLDQTLHTDDRMQQALDALVRSRLAARERAREEKDYATADAIRDELTIAGLLIEDSAQGSHWSIDGS